MYTNELSAVFSEPSSDANTSNKRIGSSSILSEYCPIQLVVMYLLALICSQLQAHQHT